MTDSAGRLSERFLELSAKSKVALSGGREVIGWLARALPAGELDLVELNRTPNSTIHGFFGQTRPGSYSASVMGCYQKVRFRRAAVADSMPSTNLATWVKSQFLKAACFRHPDGLPGGFGYIPLFGCSAADGSIRPLEGPEPPELREVGDRYDWITLQVEIHEFVRCVPALRPYVKQLSKIVREAAYIVLARDFMDFNLLPDPAIEGSCSIGYSFVPATVHPNIFGYGPGRFGVALKFFRFALLKSRDLEITMLFLSVPRSEGVFSFWGFDPVYSTVRLADMATGNHKGLLQRARDRFDRQFMLQHGNVHQASIEGLRQTWENTNWTI